MKANPKLIFWAFGIIVVIGFALTLSDVLQVTTQSDEGSLMTAACEDVRKHETLRAENDFDQMLSVIHSHLHSYRDQSDTILNEAIADINYLREEAVFRNTDLTLYHHEFARVLIQLGYLELEDATYYAEKNDLDHARTAITNAKHYVHDALTFSKNPDFDNQLKLLHIINRIDKDHLKATDLKQSLNEARSLI